MANMNQKPYDEDGNAHGEWLEYYSSGNVIYCSNWVHGVIHGFFVVFNENGTLSCKGNYNMSRKIGYWYYYYKPKEYYLWLI